MTPRAIIALALFGLLAVAGAWWAAGGSDDPSASPAAPDPEVPPPVSSAAGAAHWSGDDPAAGEPTPAGTLRLEGQVIDRDSLPVGGARVELDTRPPRATTTEQDGSFFFDGLPAGAYRVRARLDPLVATAHLSAASEVVILIVSRGAELRVSVVDPDDRPIDGAAVALTHPMRAETVTDADGEARLTGVPAGTHRLRVSADGYAALAEVVSVTSDDAAPTRLRFALQPGSRLAGIVLGPDGEPAAGARVRVRSADAVAPVRQVDEVEAAADDGTWQIDGVPAGAVRIAATHDRHGPSEILQHRVRPGDERVGIRLQLTAGGALTGRVTDDTAAPLAGVTVRARDDGGFTREAQTDARGRYALGGLPRARLEVVAFRGGVEATPATVDLAGVPETEVDFTLATGASITGVVVDDLGEGVARAEITATPEHADGTRVAGLRGGGGAAVTADEGGRFELVGLRPGRFRLRAEWPGASNDHRALTRRGVVAQAGDRDVQIVLSSHARIKGRVQYQDGTVPDAFLVRVGVSTPSPFSSRSGAFRLDEVPAGTHWITVSGKDFEKVTLEDVEVQPGATVDLGLVSVDRGRVVRGRVVTERGQPIAGARVYVGDVLLGNGSEVMPSGSVSGPDGFRLARTDNDGAFAITGIGRRASVLVAEHEGHGRSATRRIPAGDADAELELVVRATGSLSGTLTHRGEPLADEVIVASQAGAGNGRFLGRTSADGSFSFERLAPGEYVVTGYVPMGPSVDCGPQQTVRIESGEAATVTVAMPGGQSRAHVPVRAEAGNRFGMVYLSPEAIAGETPPQLEASVQNLGRSFTCIGTSREQAPLEVEGLPAGRYTACAVSIPMNPDDPNNALRVQSELARLPVVCRPWRVPGSDSQEALSLP